VVQAVVRPERSRKTFPRERFCAGVVFFDPDESDMTERSAVLA
jgi:hypothetical protein